MSMKTIKVRELLRQGNLATRENGLILRKEIEEALKTFDSVFVDFDGINLVTQSFIDEVFGVLVREKGLSFIRNHIKIKDASDFVKSMIKFVISYSQKAA